MRFKICNILLFIMTIIVCIASAKKKSVLLTDFLNNKQHNRTASANIIQVPCTGNKVRINGRCRPAFNRF